MIGLGDRIIHLSLTLRRTRDQLCNRIEAVSLRWNAGENGVRNLFRGIIIGWNGMIGGG